jgi:very-short-patch-repair endonuclease
MGLRPIPVKFQIAKETAMIALDTPLHHLTTTSTHPRTRFMTAKTNTKFGFWNVRTLNQLTKPEQVLREMKKYMVHRLKKKKKMICKTSTNT